MKYYMLCVQLSQQPDKNHNRIYPFASFKKMKCLFNFYAGFAEYLTFSELLAHRESKGFIYVLYVIAR